MTKSQYLSFESIYIIDIEGNETAGLSVGKWLTNGTQTQVGLIMTEVVDESRYEKYTFWTLQMLIRR